MNRPKKKVDLGARAEKLRATKGLKEGKKYKTTIAGKTKRRKYLGKGEEGRDLWGVGKVGFKKVKSAPKFNSKTRRVSKRK